MCRRVERAYRPAGAVVLFLVLTTRHTLASVFSIVHPVLTHKSHHAYSSQAFHMATMTATKHTVHLVPPLFEQRAADDFKHSGMTLAFALSPRDLSMLIYAPPNVRSASDFELRPGQLD